MTKKTFLSRRRFLELSSVALAGTGLGLAGCRTGSHSSSARIQVGVQLYSVRNDCKADFPGTLHRIGKIGYRGVEFAGYFGHSAKEIRQMLDDSGVIACGSHTPSEDIQPDKLEETIAFNLAIGNRYIIVPDMTGKTRKAWLEKAEWFNHVAARLAKENLSLGYHSHWHDFHPVEGELPWNIFGEHTDARVILQLDTSNCVDGGGDPLAELRKFPGRTRSIHIKANGGGPESIITEDKLDWPAIFNFCETKGGTKWYVVEHETSHDPMNAVARTFEKLKQLGKV